MNSLSTIDDEDAFLYGHPHPPGEEPARSSSRDPRLRKRLSSEGHQGPEPRSMSHDSRGSSDIFPPGDLPVGKLKEKYDRGRSRRSRSRDRRSRSPRDRRYDRRGGDGAGDDEAWKRKAEAFLQGIGATDTRPNVHQQFATANYGQAYPASTMGYGQFGGSSQLPPGFPNMSIPPPVVSGFPGAPGLPTSDRGRSPGHRRRTRSRSRDRRNRRERVAGSTSLSLLIVRLLLSHVLVPRLEQSTSNDDNGEPTEIKDPPPVVALAVKSLRVFDSLASVFSTCWLIVGSVYVYGCDPDFHDEASVQFCWYRAYMFAFVVITIGYVSLLLSILAALGACFCAKK